ncbi:hypothetical protein BV22DRAFT_1135278 [Leucogyrophana mollusca]|uniref:Uncharacterized protein n=1 Tax=Leucogyrophana mollusca TaxID=85980 RepID=A0ACB8AWD4_9AGAM|nr:hypothetical protein BV22DRAFT_1135278 [Leucogyrophana mollusca]
MSSSANADSDNVTDAGPSKSALDIPDTNPSEPNKNNPKAFVEKLKRNWAKGEHLDFLTGHLAGYSTAVLEGNSRASEYLDSVVNEYFLRFHWKLSAAEEPSSSYDPSQPPMTEQLTPIESEQKHFKVTSMRKTICMWLDYRTKANKKVGRRRAKVEGDLWARLLGQLSGISQHKPKALQPQQRWSKDYFETVVRDDFEARWAGQGNEVQKGYAKLAKTEAKAALATWRADLAAAPSTNPVDRQA